MDTIIFKKANLKKDIATKLEDIRNSAFEGNTNKARELLSNLSKDEKNRIQLKDPTFFPVMDQILLDTTSTHN